jgi:hypothetical protein
LLTESSEQLSDVRDEQKPNAPESGYSKLQKAAHNTSADDAAEIGNSQDLRISDATNGGDVMSARKKLSVSLSPGIS